MWIPQIPRKRPLAVEIVSALETDIESGRIERGSQLPTHRDLAERLQVAVGTITRAYAIAKQQGLITGTTGRGTFVAGSPVSQANSWVIDLSQNLVLRDGRDPEIRSLLARFGDVSAVASLLDFDQGPSGHERHREIAAGWLNRREFEPQASDIAICAGVQHAMMAILAGMANPGDVVMTEEVTYAGIKAIASLLRLSLVGLPMDSEGLDPEALEKTCRRGGRFLYTTPTLHNPTTTTMPERRRRQVADIVRKYGVTVLEDDVYGFLDPGAPLPVSAHVPEHSYYLASASKSMAPGLRVAYAVCPDGGQQRLANTIRTTIWETAPLMAQIVSQWIENGTAQRIIDYKRSEVAHRDRIATAILGPNPTVSPHRWIALPEAWRPEDFASECRSRGVLISPAASFAIRREGLPIAVRVCLASAGTREQLERALEIVAALLRSGPSTHFSVT